MTSAALLARKEVDRVLIVDLDVHQGDGTAAMLAHEPRAFTYRYSFYRKYSQRSMIYCRQNPIASLVRCES